MLNKIKIASSFLIVNLFLASSCGDDPKFEFPTKVFTIDKIYDVGNNNNALDIRVQVSLNEVVNTTDITEIRMIVVKSGKTLSIADVQSLPTGNFYSAKSEVGVNVIKPSSAIKDVDGNSIENDISYKVYVAALGNDDAINLSKPLDFILVNKPIYAGGYKGEWSDQKGKFKFSVTISDDYTGSIYYGENFSSCCGGLEDATLVMKLNGSIIESFNFVQYLQDYPNGTGGHCPTTVSASGEFKDDIILTLNPFPFSDCDGAGRTVTILGLTRQ